MLVDQVKMFTDRESGKDVHLSSAFCIVLLALFCFVNLLTFCVYLVVDNQWCPFSKGQQASNFFAHLRTRTYPLSPPSPYTQSYMPPVQIGKTAL